MVQVDIMCAAIRLTPVWICLGVYTAGGRWPTRTQAMRSVIEYGFSVQEFKRRPMVLLTHLFVHANDSHLLGNLFSLTNTLIEFGGPSVTENVEEDDVEVTVSRTIGSLIVFVVGGIAGGIGGQLLFNDAKLLRRYGKGLILRKEEPPSLVEQAHDWIDWMKGKVEKRINDGIFMCGASAGIASLAGFNAAYHNRWAAAVFFLVPEVAAAVSAAASADSRGFWSGWIPAGEVVGHAAHIGGFVVGGVMGYAWKQWERRKQKRRNAF